MPDAAAARAADPPLYAIEAAACMEAATNQTLRQSTRGGCGRYRACAPVHCGLISSRFSARLHSVVGRRLRNFVNCSLGLLGLTYNVLPLRSTSPDGTVPALLVYEFATRRESFVGLRCNFFLFCN